MRGKVGIDPFGGDQVLERAVQVLAKKLGLSKDAVMKRALNDEDLASAISQVQDEIMRVNSR